MVQLAEPIITPAPRPTLLGRQYVRFRPRQTVSYIHQLQNQFVENERDRPLIPIWV